MKTPVYRKVASAMEIPEDLSEKASLVEVTGQDAVRIENYLGIIEYSASRLLLQCKKCRLEITGNKLFIESYTRDELLLRGRIDQVHYF